MDSSNVNSLLMINDDRGRLFCHLDGTFSLGFVPIETNVVINSMVKHPFQPIFVGQPSIVRGNSSQICLTPMVIHMPLLTQRNARDLAALTSTARELMLYAIRVITEMQGIWNGSESNTGAREFGPKWIGLLETKQKEQFGRVCFSLLDPVKIIRICSRRNTDSYPGSNHPSDNWSAD